ncbi:MAG: hypothetical protein HY328_14865 [Chloroflexi bacterium]|nr:hypothetical protein [Chloroflexota bacterium]
MGLKSTSSESRITFDTRSAAKCNGSLPKAQYSKRGILPLRLKIEGKSAFPQASQREMKGKAFFHLLFRVKAKGHGSDCDEFIFTNSAERASSDAAFTGLIRHLRMPTLRRNL